MKTLLMAVLTAGFVHAQGGSLSGCYGFLFNEYMNNTSQADTSGLAVIGVMNFDGAGNVSGTYTVAQGATLAGFQNSTSQSGTLTGTYSGNADGTGTLNIIADSGATLTFATVTTDSGKGFQMVLTANSFGVAGMGIPLGGSAQSLSGKLPGSFLHGNSTGSIPLSLTGTTSGGMTVYTATGATGSGTATCGDGSTVTWNATVPSLTVATTLPTVGGGGSGVGDFLLTVFYTGCNGKTAQTLVGQVNGNTGNNGAINLVLQGPGGVISGMARAAAPGASLSGSYGMQFTNSPLPASSVGVLQFDGMGNVTVSQTFVGTAGNGNNQPSPVTASGAGTYTINSDGSGLITMPNGNGNNQTYAFVITDSGSQVLFLRTDSRSNPAVAFGTARAE